MEMEIKKARFIAKLLDSQFSVRGIRFGLDPVINIIPGLGDLIGMMLSLYIFRIAREMGVSRFDKWRMIGNIILDFIIGIIPIIGVIFDVVFKANIRNLKILEKYSTRMKIKGKVIEGDVVS